MDKKISLEGLVDVCVCVCVGGGGEEGGGYGYLQKMAIIQHSHMGAHDST